jgi:hypothetical protein
VSTTGNDSTGNGTSGLPWLTIQHAANYVADTIDLAGYNATIQLADGTYSAGLALTQPLVGGGAPNLVINGNSTTPSNVLISTTGNCFQATGTGAGFTVQNLEMTSSTSHCLISQYGATIFGGAGLIFGAATSGFHATSNSDGQISLTANYTIIGGALAHIYCQINASFNLNAGITVTLTGTPNFSQAFVFAQNGSILAQGVTYSGAATGVYYLVTLNGVINTNGGGPTYFPGSSAGSASTGGQYN